MRANRARKNERTGEKKKKYETYAHSEKVVVHKRVYQITSIQTSLINSESANT